MSQAALTPPSRRFSLFAAGLIVLIWLVLYLLPGLHDFPIQLWDESRQGVNALEMLRSNEWIVTSYDGRPDLWQTKPPLLIWLQALSMSIFGPADWAMRLPSTLACLVTVLAVFRTAQRWLSPWAGLAAALVLLTAPGYLREHVALTGDYDALLTLWTTLLALQWLRYTQLGRRRDAFLCALWVVLAVLTKSIAGLLMLPGLLLFALLSGAGRQLLRPALWLAVALAAVGVASWYGVREAALAGYLQAVRENELGQRMSTAIEGHAHSRFWYFELMVTETYTWWLLPTVAGWVAGLTQPRGTAAWRLALFSLLAPLSHLLVITMSSTKLHWYDAPIYPLLALSVAVLVDFVHRRFLPRVPAAVLVAGVLLAAALPLYHRVQFIDQLPSFGRNSAEMFIADHLAVQAQQQPTLVGFAFAHAGYHSTLDFYRLATERRLGSWLTSAYPEQIGEQSADQVVVVCGQQLRRRWEQQWDAQVLVQTDSCATLRLLRRR